MAIAWSQKWMYVVRPSHEDPLVLSMRQYSQIAESSHTILNPFSLDKLLLLGDICSPEPDARHLDLASGKGELVCQLAARHQTRGVGVDVHQPFVEAARARADELDVADRVEFLIGDASGYQASPAAYDIVSCIGATWIGGGLAGTLHLMRPWIDRGGWLLVGEPYWTEAPPPDAEVLHGDLGIASLAGTLDAIEAADLSLVEMVLANQDDWDRYAASQWLNVDRWLDENADHPIAGELQTMRDQWRRQYLTYDRRYLGWGVFVLRPVA